MAITVVTALFDRVRTKAMLEHLAQKLPVSRLQRDLTERCRFDSLMHADRRYEEKRIGKITKSTT